MPHNLNRFLQAQQRVYDDVVAELRAGRKRSHWMWFVFPQFDGLGFSPTAQRYAIKSLDEARQYLDHPVLGARLKECCEILLGVEGRSIEDIFGFPDHLKLVSCMTLFDRVAEPGNVFEAVLDRYCQGQRDGRTLQLLEDL